MHCPLWPAPLPPFVGGGGLANAGAVAASANELANAKHATLRRMLTSFPRQRFAIVPARRKFAPLTPRDCHRKGNRDPSASLGEVLLLATTHVKHTQDSSASRVILDRRSRADQG